MDIRYNEKKLSEMLENVYELIRTPISIFDGDFKFITSYPPTGYLTDYCRIVRESEKRRELCRLSDEKNCSVCKREGRPVSSICHAGLHETVTPIRYESSIIGYIMFGEYRMEGDGDRAIAYARAEGIDEGRLAAAYSALTVLTERQVRATLEILRSFILEFWLSDAILLSESALSDRIKRFIDENLERALTAEEISRSFFVSRQRLYAVFKESFGMPIKQYILNKKMERARHLLTASDKSVAEIAALVGFSDYNNFIQRFKKMNGKTPLAYRRDAAR